MVKRAQAATELTVLLALIMIGFIIIVSTGQTTTTATTAVMVNKKATEFLNEVEHNSVLVYNQGVGAKTQIYAELPTGVNSVSFNNNILSINYSYGGSTRLIERALSFQINGSLQNVEAGSQTLTVEAKEGYVQIETV